MGTFWCTVDLRERLLERVTAGWIVLVCTAALGAVPVTIDRRGADRSPAVWWPVARQLALRLRSGLSCRGTSVGGLADPGLPVGWNDVVVSSASCIFCQASASTTKITKITKITKEDVLSKWIDDVLTTAVTGEQRSFEWTVVGPTGVRSQSSWPGHSLAAIKVPVVCVTCNNGWMCGYDGQVKHLVKDAILGQDISLTPGQQLVVADWVTMKAMVLEYGWGAADPVFIQDDRSLLYHEQRPPAYVQVRLAAVESNGQPIQVFHRVAIRGPRTPTPRPEDLHVLLTMAWGCLVVQVLGGPTVGDEALRRAPVAADTYVQIYPPAERTIQWPPSTALDDATIQRFSDPNCWRGSTFDAR